MSKKNGTANTRFSVRVSTSELERLHKFVEEETEFSTISAYIRSLLPILSARKRGSGEVKE